MSPSLHRRGPLLGLAVLLLAVMPAGCGRDETSSESVVTEAETTISLGDSTEVALYFPSESGRLQRESREIPGAEDVTGRVRQLVEALLAGPDGSGLFAPMPEGVSLGAVQVTPAAIAYLDFESTDRNDLLSLGSRGELLTVYSLVDTVLLNVEEVRAVVLLWNGHQRFSLAGHVDTASPLTANRSLISGE